MLILYKIKEFISLGSKDPNTSLNISDKKYYGSLGFQYFGLYIMFLNYLIILKQNTVNIYKYINYVMICDIQQC